MSPRDVLDQAEARALALVERGYAKDALATFGREIRSHHELGLLCAPILPLFEQEQQAVPATQLIKSFCRKARTLILESQ